MSGLCGVRALWLEHKIPSGCRGGESCSCAGIERNVLMGDWVGFQWGEMGVSVPLFNTAGKLPFPYLNTYYPIKTY